MGTCASKTNIICQPSISLFFVSELFVVSANIYIKSSDFFRHQFPFKRRGHGTEREELVITVFTHGTERKELVIVVFAQADKNARGRTPPISRQVIYSPHDT